MDHLDDKAAQEDEQLAAESRALFAQASGAADERLRGEPAHSEHQDAPQHKEEEEEEHHDEPAAASAPGQAAADPDTMFADASPAQREYLKSLMAERDREAQAARSANGRYAATQRQLADKEAQFKQQITAIQSAGERGQDTGRQLDAMEQRIEAMREDYPDLADHMQGIADEMRNNMRQVLEPVARLEEEEQARTRNEVLAIETDELTRRHPDAHEVVTTPAFATWLSQQSGNLQALANSDAATDADLVLTLYKNSALQAKTQRKAIRQRQLADMTPLGSSQGRATVDNADADSLYARAASAADKRLTQKQF